MTLRVTIVHHFGDVAVGEAAYSAIMTGETEGIDLLVSACVGVSGRGLVLGCDTSAVVESLGARGIETRAVSGDWPSVQLPVRFPVVIVGSDALAGPDAAAVVHCAVQHLLPGGLVVIPVVDGADIQALGARFELEPVGSVIVDGRVARIGRRTDRHTIHDMVFEARSSIRRIEPAELAARLADEPTLLVVDIRTPTDRQRFGVIAGSTHVPRTVLEWHLDPANGYRHPDVRAFDQPIVVVCNGGYSSSLGAANLQRLGFTDVSDLIGGHRAWLDAGLPVVAPDHSHLDL